MSVLPRTLERFNAVFDRPEEDLGERVVHAFLDVWESTSVEAEPLMAMLRGAVVNEFAREQLRDFIRARLLDGAGRRAGDRDSAILRVLPPRCSSVWCWGGTSSRCRHWRTPTATTWCSSLRPPSTACSREAGSWATARDRVPIAIGLVVTTAARRHAFPSTTRAGSTVKAVTGQLPTGRGPQRVRAVRQDLSH